jgi:hypothetical protein
MAFTVRYKLSHFTFLIFQTVHFLRFFFPFFGKTFYSLRIFHGMLYLGKLSPAAPAAWSAASGPAPVPAPVRGRLYRSWLASSRVVAAPPSTLLASRVGVPAQVRRQLAGQPQRGRYRLWCRPRRWLGGLCCRWRGGPHWDHRLQPRSLGYRLLRLATAGDARHQLCGRHSGGV